MIAVFPSFPSNMSCFSGKGCPRFSAGTPLLEEQLFADPPEPFSGEKLSSVALLPGSRGSEVRHLLPVLLEAVPLLLERGIRPWVSLAPGLSKDVQDLLLSSFPGEYCTREPGRELMKRTDAVLGACGTAAVEALLLQRYMVVLYRMSPLNWGILSLLRQCKCVGVSYGAVPNLLGGAPIYPELLQNQARGETGVALLEAYGGSPDLRGILHERMKAARKRLGVSGAFHLWARKALGYLLP